MGKQQKSKIQRHNTDKNGGKSFAKREHLPHAGQKHIPVMKGRSVTETVHDDGSRTIVTRGTVKMKAKGAPRQKMPDSSHWNPTGTSLTPMHNTLAHEMPDVMGGPGTSRNMLRTSDAANKGDTFIEHGARTHMSRKNKGGTYHAEFTSHLDPGGRRTHKTTVFQREGSVTAFRGTVRSGTG